MLWSPLAGLASTILLNTTRKGRGGGMYMESPVRLAKVSTGPGVAGWGWEQKKFDSAPGKT